ncbi:hypothetical protein D5S17_35545 [Pseudonocardiaceae bacterium YIM PH 21723]|nr:hypothetical protein D5S17_35545 [Pseudonocardiaceae bacterium YIM PH 21723]
MSLTHHLFSGDYGPNSQLSIDINAQSVTLEITEPAISEQIHGKVLASVTMDRFDADRFLTEALRWIGSFDTPAGHRDPQP